MSNMATAWIQQEHGQSLVELALIVPILLFILLGVADLGRAFYYTTAIASAAREAAAYAASPAYAALATPQKQSGLNTKACAATGLDPSGDCGTGRIPPDPLAVKEVTSPVPGPGCDGATPSGSVAVEVTYNFTFISSYLVNRVFPTQSLLLRACATFPRLTS
jgi:hypothetical protein